MTQSGCLGFLARLAPLGNLLLFTTGISKLIIFTQFKYIVRKSFKNVVQMLYENRIAKSLAIDLQDIVI